MHTEVDQAINIRKSVDYTFKLFFTTTILSWPTVFFSNKGKIYSINRLLIEGIYNIF